MANISDGTFANGRSDSNFINSIARTDTTAKVLFTLPANCLLLGLTITSLAVSNAATTATISVGIQGGSQTAYLNALDVKGATGVGQTTPQSLGTIGTQAATTVVTGIYAETGTASTVGGPWNVVAVILEV